MGSSCDTGTGGAHEPEEKPETKVRCLEGGGQREMGRDRERWALLRSADWISSSAASDAYCDPSRFVRA